MNKKIITFIAIISLLLAYTNNCIAASISELNEQKQQAENQKDQVTEQKENAQNELDDINAQISSIESEIFKLQNKLDELNSSISQKEQEIEEKQKELEHKEDLLKTRMVAMYKGGGTTYLDVLLGSSNYIEMYTKYNAIQTIAEKDTELINEVTEQKKNIESEKQELENNKAQVESVKSETDAKNAELKAAKVAKQSVVNNLSAEEQELQKKIEEFEDAIEKAQAEIAQATQGTSGYEGSFSGGKFEWPISYSYNNQKRSADFSRSFFMFYKSLSDHRSSPRECTIASKASSSPSPLHMISKVICCLIPRLKILNRLFPFTRRPPDAKVISQFLN